MKRLKIQINGIVQGVGFRPFLHRLAKENFLSGFCFNTVNGMEIEVQGEKSALCLFKDSLENQAPSLSKIREIWEKEIPVIKNEEGFFIKKSDKDGNFATLISPDIATCTECKKELFCKDDRRFNYPFINCTSCGPRFTIIKDLPYDRDKTSMAAFKMCGDCQKEYEDIETRHYHAQPDCCEKCGPKHKFIKTGEEAKSLGDSLVPGEQGAKSVGGGAGQVEGEDFCFGSQAIKEAKDLIKSGKILAIKGMGGFHLACLATDSAAVKRLREKKQRDERPFALMCKDSKTASKYVKMTKEEKAVLESRRAPIVLLKKKDESLLALSETSELGIMLPYTPLHILLMEDFDILVMTSMNLSDLPVICDESRDISDWRALCDGILTHNRDIVNRCDDSLLRVYNGHEYFIRRSRGYTPEPIEVSEDISGILGLGAEQKASFCLGRGKEAFLSQHIGDLKNEETFGYYKDQIERFKELFGIRVTGLVRDLHPDYLSSNYAEDVAKSERIPTTLVQHHHAHLASCMVDNGLDEKVIGLTWDGTGLGTDGTIWGSECLVGDFTGFIRVGSIKPIPLPGGDLCTKEINRIAISLKILAGKNPQEDFEKSLETLIKNNINSPLSSGMGRLFDGVYSLITGRKKVSYEGQGAVLLENLAGDFKDLSETYPLSFYNEKDVYLFDTGALVREIYNDLVAAKSPVKIAIKFHNAITQMAVSQCIFAREKHGINKVVLSGGVFQNMRLLRGISKALKEDGFTVYSHKRLSCNDEGISLGQVMIAKRGGGQNVFSNAP